MKKLTALLFVLLLVASCGQSYEETKRISREQRREAARRDSAALKIAILPTLDALPLLVAREENLLDTLNGGVRLKMYRAQMDCDTALSRGRVEGCLTDVVRALYMEQHGTPIRYVTATNGYWQLIGNRLSRIRQLSQLDDKMVAMTRHSSTDLLSDHIRERGKIAEEHLFKIQINDVNVRLQMLLNNEIDALWLTEPYATAARQYKHPVLFDSREPNLQTGVLAFREKEMRRQARSRQLELLVKAYNQACDLINERGISHYRQLIAKQCKVRASVVDSLPAGITFHHAQGPRQQDIERAKLWLEQQSQHNP